MPNIWCRFTTAVHCVTEHLLLLTTFTNPLTASDTVAAEQPIPEAAATEQPITETAVVEQQSTTTGQAIVEAPPAINGVR